MTTQYLPGMLYAYFLNDAVLRAFELQTGIEVVRPNISGLMGAYGAALTARMHYEPGAVSAMMERNLDGFTVTSAQRTCQLCQNHCKLTITNFDDGARHVSGNRCERGASLDVLHPTTGEKLGIAITLAVPADRFKVRAIERFTTQQIPASVIEGLEPRFKPEQRSNSRGGFGDRPNRGGGDRPRSFGDRSAQPRSFGDELFRVQPELPERIGSDALEDRCDRSADQLRLLGDLTQQVVLHLRDRKSVV